jgi:hypothetical protein
VIIYLADTRSSRLLAEMRERRAGMMVIRGRLKARLTAVRWAYDNGAFADFKAGRPFDFDAWQRDLDEIAKLSPAEAPDFAVLPDIVGGGAASLARSLEWLPKLRGVCGAWYLPVQEGIAPADIPELPAHAGGFFVGGAATAWKVRTAPLWRAEAVRRGLLCHAGRVGTGRRVRAMREAGVDSIDSAVPLYSVENWRAFWNEVDSTQGAFRFNSS